MNRDQALAAAYAAHAAEVTRIAARVLRDAEAARDVCQEAFVRLHARLPELRGEPGPWLRAVAWRLSLDGLRRRRREVGALEARGGEPLPAALDPLDLAGEGERGERVREALLALSERQREVLLLRVVGGETFPALARALDISEGAAKVHLRRALDRLRELCGEDGGEAP